MLIDESPMTTRVEEKERDPSSQSRRTQKARSRHIFSRSVGGLASVFRQMVSNIVHFEPANGIVKQIFREDALAPYLRSKDVKGLAIRPRSRGTKSREAPRITLRSNVLQTAIPTALLAILACRNASFEAIF